MTTPPSEEKPVILNWTAVAVAEEYYVYCDPFNNGIFGFVGTAKTNKFYDPGVAPDFSITPPILKAVFDAAGKYPAKSCHFQQRQCYANSNIDHEKVWGSRTAAYQNFGISTPLRDDDAIEFVLAGKHLNPVSWMVPLAKLVVFNDEGVFIANGDDTGALVPTSVNLDQLAYSGAHPDVEPVVVGNSILYVDDSQKCVRHLTFTSQDGGFDGGDRTITASHLFDGYWIVDMDYAKRPHSIMWAVRSDGVLLGYTYVPDQEVAAWHHHTTDGVIESVAVLPSRPGDDDVYVLVRRTIGGVQKRYIEVLGHRWIPDLDDIEDAFYVDSGLSYAGAPATVFSNLTHLEGKRVAILADGVVVSDGFTGTVYTVTGGSVTIPTAASVVHIGLPMPYADLETLEIDVQGTGVRPLQKLVASVVVLLRTSRQGFSIGPDADHLTRNRPEPWEATADLVTQQTAVIVTNDWNPKGKFLLRHTDPVPFAIVGLVPQIEVGA